MYYGALNSLTHQPKMPEAILVVEDEPELRELLVFTLNRAGYETLEAESAERALQIANHQSITLALVDWMLPGMSGVDLAHRLRQDQYTKDLPIIMLTARSEEVDKLKSFASGVDDYVTKPFSPRELVARIKALLRRTGIDDSGILEAAGIRIEKSSHKVTVDGDLVHLGPTEFRLLEFFLSNSGQAFDRAKLLDRVWGRTSYLEERTVDVHVLRLRKILKAYNKDQLIETVRGLGYRFDHKRSD